jgi:hypothetical protein
LRTGRLFVMFIINFMFYKNSKTMLNLINKALL